MHIVLSYQEVSRNTGNFASNEFSLLESVLNPELLPEIMTTEETLCRSELHILLLRTILQSRDYKRSELTTERSYKVLRGNLVTNSFFRAWRYIHSRSECLSYDLRWFAFVRHVFCSIRERDDEKQLVLLTRAFRGTSLCRS